MAVSWRLIAFNLFPSLAAQLYLPRSNRVRLFFLSERLDCRYTALSDHKYSANYFSVFVGYGFLIAVS